MAVHEPSSPQFEIYTSQNNSLDLASYENKSIRELRIIAYNFLDIDIDYSLLSNIYFLFGTKNYYLEIIKKRHGRVRNKIDTIGVYRNYEMSLFDLDSVEWLIKDFRATCWFLNHFSDLDKLPIKFTKRYEVTDFLIAIMDIATFTVDIPQVKQKVEIGLVQFPKAEENKLRILAGFKKLWFEIKDLNKLDKLISEDLDEINWTFNYLKNKGFLIYSDVFHFSEEDTDSRKAQILATIDCLGNYQIFDLRYFDRSNPNYMNLIFFDKQWIDVDRQHLFVNKLRMGWSQQKQRNKNQLLHKHMYLLSIDAKRKLEIMAKVRNRSESQIIDELIQTAYQTSDFVDEKGKDKYKI